MHRVNRMEQLEAALMKLGEEGEGKDLTEKLLVTRSLFASELLALAAFDICNTLRVVHYGAKPDLEVVPDPPEDVEE